MKCEKVLQDPKQADIKANLMIDLISAPDQLTQNILTGVTLE